MMMPKKQYGFSLIELLLALFVLAILLPSVIGWLALSERRADTRTAAEHIRMVANATQNRINEDGMSWLEDVPAANGQWEQKTDDLLDELDGYLPDDFGTHPWGKQYSLYYQIVGESVYAIVVASNGDGQDEDRMREASTQIGAAGGVGMGEDDDLCDASLCGVGGGWFADDIDDALLNPPALAFFLDYDVAGMAGSGEYLHRTSDEDGRNRMEVSLDMGGQTIENVTRLEPEDPDEGITMEGDVVIEDGQMYPGMAHVQPDVRVVENDTRLSDYVDNLDDMCTKDGYERRTTISFNHARFLGSSNEALPLHFYNAQVTDDEDLYVDAVTADPDTAGGVLLWSNDPVRTSGGSSGNWSGNASVDVDLTIYCVEE